MNERTFTEIDNALRGLDDAAIAMRDQLLTLGRLRDVLQAEFERLDAERAQLVLLSEDEAATILRTTPRQLRDDRTRLNLPHCRIGRNALYTREQLAEIIAIYSGRDRRRVQPFRRAA